ncbi:MAG: dihydrolipoamide acetyltransferase [Acidobacteria bacterium]|nr:MAG: dihydrolipoamide acetyltransferase [Acidobacteriota bacterium]
MVEVEAPADGFLAGIKASEGADIPVGQTIAWILEAGEKPPADVITAARSARAGTHAKSEVSQSRRPAPSTSVPPASAAKISPKARRLAKELGVDVALVQGTGAAGEILASDVESAARARGASDAAAADSASMQESGNVEVPAAVGRLMAERTTQSWTTVPHFFVTREVDASALNSYRERILRDMETTDAARVTHTDLLVALTARVLSKHPRLNASWSSAGVRLHEYVNMGVAIAVSDGVVTAVIANAHRATLAEIARQRREIADRARSGKLRPADISGATFTISNLGMYQVDQFHAIIVPPQAAILAVGTIRDRVVAVQGKAEVRPMMTLTVSCDHRVADGARAAMFLSDLAQALNDPKEILK